MPQEPHQLEYRPNTSERRKIVSPRSVVEMATAAVLAWCVMVLPVLLDSERRRSSDAVFLPFMADAMYDTAPYSLPLLFVLWLLLGVFGKAPALLLGLATIAPFAMWSAIDTAMGGRSFELFPLEWVVYALGGAVGTGCIALPRIARWLRKKAAVMRSR